LRLSVVIPALEEEAVIGGLLEYLSGLSGVDEIVVADGGSTDATVRISRDKGARLIVSEPGRGMQLRAGAETATGDALLFLHSDTTPPPDAALQIERALGAGCVGGNFRLRYPGGGALGLWLEVLVLIYRRLGRYYGDSGFFVRRDVYEKIGGFPAVPVMEDVILARRLERAGKTAFLPGPMLSSPRRWKGRTLRTLFLWLAMQLAYEAGVSPWRLARFYRLATGGEWSVRSRG
jgi:rSAM/selenodomain-associated transferase 2